MSARYVQFHGGRIVNLAVLGMRRRPAQLVFWLDKVLLLLRWHDRCLDIRSELCVLLHWKVSGCERVSDADLPSMRKGKIVRRLVLVVRRVLSWTCAAILYNCGCPLLILSCWIIFSVFDFSLRGMSCRQVSGAERSAFRPLQELWCWKERTVFFGGLLGM